MQFNERDMRDDKMNGDQSIHSGSQGQVSQETGYSGYHGPTPDQSSLTYLSPNYIQIDSNLVRGPEGTEHSINDTIIKIKIFEDRVNGWFLDVAENLKTNRSAGFVILSVAVSYIEGVQQFIDGKPSKNESQNRFAVRMETVFNKFGITDLIAREFYKSARNGLFHDGMTRKMIKISSAFSSAIRYDGNDFEINPVLFLDEIRKDFEAYINALIKAHNDGNNAGLIANFLQMWNNPQ